MKSATSRILTALSMTACCVLNSGASAPTQPPLRPDKLLILSTTDVKGKTGPCGCHVPKGGLSRRAFYIDSLKSSYGQVLVVDNGGFFPRTRSIRKQRSS